mmetsp:Transcript_64496/g.135338  ORF Transcript_64496/g.135338 Transcript_64496/m.135338 type:complete len:204 (+) Transcript_64496:645-1256(+)
MARMSRARPLALAESATAPWTSHWKAALHQACKMLRRSVRSRPTICGGVSVTSTRGTKTTGAKKRRPTTRGSCVRRPNTPNWSRTPFWSFPNGMESVLVARITCGEALMRARAKMSLLSSTLSGTASITMSASLHASSTERQLRACLGATSGQGFQGMVPDSAGGHMPERDSKFDFSQSRTTSKIFLFSVTWPLSFVTLSVWS